MSGNQAENLDVSADAADLRIRDQERDVLVALGRIIRCAGSGIREAGRGAGLGASHLLVLQLLEAEGSRKAGEIARDLSFSKSTITAILDGLEERDLILRDRNERDGRSVDVSLTDAGRNALAVPAPFQVNFLKRFGNLPDWERALVLAGLLRVCELVAAAPPLA